ncbi:MAG: DUF3822 family protein [Prolixibacteraceae bacterium]
MVEFITDNSFDLNNTSAYNLSIQVSLDGFSFLILDKNRLLAWKNTVAKISSEKFIARRLREWLDSEEVLQKKFNDVGVTYFSRKFTCIPEAFFEEDKKEKVCELLFPDLTGQNIVACRTDKSVDRLLCAIPDNLEKLLIKQFSNYLLAHPVQHLTAGLQQVKTASENQMAIWLGAKNLFVTIIKNEQVQLVNQFSFSNSNDVLYFVFSALKQIGISPHKTSLYLSGYPDGTKDLLIKMNKYFERIDFLKPNEEWKLDAENLEIPKHQLISLF